MGLCLSGPRAPGHWGYGIAAAAAVVIHLMFRLFAGVLRSEPIFLPGYNLDDPFITRWGVLPTRLDATMFFLTSICYHEQQGGFTPPGTFALSMVSRRVGNGPHDVHSDAALVTCRVRALDEEELATNARGSGHRRRQPGFAGA